MYCTKVINNKSIVTITKPTTSFYSIWSRIKNDVVDYKNKYWDSKSDLDKKKIKRAGFLGIAGAASIATVVAILNAR